MPRNMKKKAISAESALERLEELCARSEQCSSDLRNKLYRWNVEPPHDSIIESLISRGFVNDKRFARAFTRDKYRFDRWGRIKIARALAVKRIDRDIINDALEEIDTREYARNCFNLLHAKKKSLTDASDSYVTRQKLLRYAAGRGYEPALILHLLDNDRLWD